MENNDTTLIMGGARSGKSKYAEKLALKSEFDLIYIATGEARDNEMQNRIDHHKNRRGTRWNTIEEPLKIAAEIGLISDNKTLLLIDCLTLWLSNIIERNRNIEEETNILINAIKSARCPLILVSNEVGQGIVPINKLAREFRDETGRLNQKIAACVSNVYFVMAGLPLPLKENNKLMTKAFDK